MIGIRGAVRVERNDRDAIYRDTQRLLRRMTERNGLRQEDLVSAFFTMTPDLNSDFPAYAAREMGWDGVPMLGAQETPVPGALDRMIRVLLHADAEGPAEHVYLGEAAAMRPDLAGSGDVDAGSGTPAPSEPAFGTLLVVGLGLIGGSVALAARRSGRFSEVLGHDLDELAMEQARRAGAVSGRGEDLEPLLDRAEVVLLAIPVARIPEWLDRWGGRLVRGTVVIDVGSTKHRVVEAMAQLPEGVEAVGAHPMAGSDESGMGAARPDLFYGAPWALVESARSGSRGRRVARGLVEAVGGVPFWTEPAAHDAAAACTSHLPYTLSAALARHVADRGSGASGEEVGALVGPGLKDMTRLAGSDSRLMAEILATNWPRVKEEIAEFRGRLDALLERVDSILGEAESEGAEAPVSELARELRRAQSARRAIVERSPSAEDGAESENFGDRG